MACIAMFLICIFIAPMVQRNSPSTGQTQQKEPQWLRQWIDKLPGLYQSPQPSTKKQRSVKLSGSCFDMARLAAIQNGIDPTTYARQINQESGCQASICSSAGACGAAQLMPSTAAYLGVNPMNVSQSLSAGAHLMAGYLRMYNGSWALALSCYNAGTGATAYAVKTYGNDWLNHMPAETRNYVAAILGQGV